MHISHRKGASPVNHTGTSAVDRRRPRGFALIMTLGVILLLTIAALTVARNATFSLESVSMRLYERQALHAAEGGVAAAIVALRADAAFTGFTPAERTLPGDSALRYQVDVTNNNSGSVPVVAPDGTLVPVGAVYLRSTGRSLRGVSRLVTTLATRASSGLFQYAVFGDRSVTLGGATTVDAWDSSLGAYSPATVVPNAGNVGTNGVTARVLSLGGGSVINGDAYIGPGGNPSQAVSGGSSITGTIKVNASAVELSVPASPVTGTPPYSKVTVGNGQTKTLAPGTYGDLSVNGTLTLQTGTYVFAAGNGSTGSVTIKGSLALAPGAGPVRVFFNGTWESNSGGIVNPTGSAANLVILGTSTATSVKLTGGSQAVYGLFAPTATIKITGGSDIWGSVVGKTLDIHGTSRIHFDTGLLNLSDLRGTSDWALTALHRG